MSSARPVGFVEALFAGAGPEHAVVPFPRLAAGEAARVRALRR